MSRRSSDETRDLAFGAIVRAARSGLPCPTNPELCQVLGASSVSSGANAIASLERRGLIKVDRFNSGRDVFIPSLGLSTRPFAGKKTPHWRSEGREPKPSVVKSERVERAHAILTPAPVCAHAAQPSAPCFRCGARGWCGHDGRVAA